MPIYNVGKYLREAIDSLINQSIGFEENMELIIVDDGSTDNSKDIALKYQEKYPKNIKVFSKLNGGQATAFNLGLKHVSGKYINFLDSDDYISLNAFEDVYNFFEKHYDEIDLVSIPIMFFERATGPHMLNYKFHSTRVIDLIKQPYNPQLSIPSSFLKKEALEGFEFNTELPHGDDALLINMILSSKKKYGVIDSAYYYYRKRLDNTSKLDNTIYKEENFTFTLKNLYLSLIEYYKEKEGEVPKFIQYVIAYDLKGFNVVADLPESFSEEEKNEFFEVFHEILTYVDEDVINFVKINRIEHVRSFLMYLKNNRDFHVEFNEEKSKVCFKTGDYVFNKLHRNKIYIEDISIHDGILKLMGFVSNSSYSSSLSMQVIKKLPDGTEEIFEDKFENISREESEVKKILGIDWHFKHHFYLEIPFDKNQESKVEMHLIFNGEDERIVMDNPIGFRDSAQMVGMVHYLVEDSHILYFKENSFNICPYSEEKVHELNQDLSLYIQDLLESEKEIKRENRSLSIENESLNRKNQSLNRRNEKLKDKNEKLKASLKKSRDENKDIKNSTSWKITKPIRMPKQYIQKKK